MKTFFQLCLLPVSLLNFLSLVLGRLVELHQCRKTDRVWRGAGLREHHPPPISPLKEHRTDEGQGLYLAHLQRAPGL